MSTGVVMSKKNRSRQLPQQKAESFNPKARPSAPAAGGEPGLGKKNHIVIAVSLALISLGYILLKKADPAGGNIYAKLAPAVLLTGYLLIPAALFVNKKNGTV